MHEIGAHEIGPIPAEERRWRGNSVFRGRVGPHAHGPGRGLALAVVGDVQLGLFAVVEVHARHVLGHIHGLRDVLDEVEAVGVRGAVRGGGRRHIGTHQGHAVGIETA